MYNVKPLAFDVKSITLLRVQTKGIGYVSTDNGRIQLFRDNGVLAQRRAVM